MAGHRSASGWRRTARWPSGSEKPPLPPKKQRGQFFVDLECITYHQYENHIRNMGIRLTTKILRNEIEGFYEEHFSINLYIFKISRSRVLFFSSPFLNWSSAQQFFHLKRDLRLNLLSQWHSQGKLFSVNKCIEKSWVRFLAALPSPTWPKCDREAKLAPLSLFGRVGGGGTPRTENPISEGQN